MCIKCVYHSYTIIQCIFYGYNMDSRILIIIIHFKKYYVLSYVNTVAVFDNSGK